MEYIWHYKTPIGGITLAANTLAVTGLWFDGQKHYADTLEEEHEEKLIPVIGEAIRWLDIYFSGMAPDFTPPLCMKTTLFRKRVWEIMLTIPEKPGSKKQRYRRTEPQKAQIHEQLKVACVILKYDQAVEVILCHWMPAASARH